MRGQANSTIALLLFVKLPNLDFSRIVSELETALSGCTAARRAITSDCDDVALFDLDGSRVGLAWTKCLEPSQMSCLAISVGHGPANEDPAHFAERRETLCRVIVDRIQGHYPADAVLWHHRDAMTTCDALDEMIGELQGISIEDFDIPSLQAAAAQPAAPEPEVSLMDDSPSDDDQINYFQIATEDAPVAEMPVAEAPVIKVVAAQDAAEVERLLARMTGELASVSQRHADRILARNARPERRRIVMNKATDLDRLLAKITDKTGPADTSSTFPEVANDLPDLPLVKMSQTQRIREALYPIEEPKAPDSRSDQTTQMRVAIYTVNMSVMMVSLPLGGAILTYNLLRGEDMRLTARALAVAGTLFGMTQTAAAQQLIFGMI